MEVQNSGGNIKKAANTNSGNKQKSMSIKTLAGALVVLFVAVVIGVVIREFRSGEQEPVIETPVAAQPVEEPKVPEIPRRVPRERPAPVKEVVVEPVPAPEPVPQEQVQNDQVYTQDDQAAMRRQQRMQDAMQWMSWFNNLPQEYRQQLMQSTMTSFISLMQRWQNMPQDQAQAEQAQLRDMFQQFGNLPDDQREQGIQDIQRQLEQIILSGQQ